MSRSPRVGRCPAVACRGLPCPAAPCRALPCAALHTDGTNLVGRAAENDCIFYLQDLVEVSAIPAMRRASPSPWSSFPVFHELQPPSTGASKRRQLSKVTAMGNGTEPTRIQSPAHLSA